MNAQGTVFKYGDNIDTDVIIPARYLNTQNAKELAAHCMGGHDKTFITRVQPGDIMVGGENFGLRVFPRACAAGHQNGGRELRDCQKLCAHLLPQRHQPSACRSWNARRRAKPSAKATW